MPSYDYLCQSCGPFTEMRRMSESGDPQPCPLCGTSSQRAFLRAPSLGQGAGAGGEGAGTPAPAHVHSGNCGCGGLRRNAF